MNFLMSRLLTCFILLLATPSLLRAGFSLSELKTVQSKVQAQLPQVGPSVVAIDSATGAATGVIISPDGLLLTAAHVVQGMLEEGAKDGMVSVILADGGTATAKLLGYDSATDAGMMQIISTKKDWPYVKLGRGLAAVNVGDWCFALGHPGGRDAARGTVLRVGKVLKISANAVQTDCVLMGGDSGGPLFNLRGEVIGIHSQIWEGRDQNSHASLAPFLRSWEQMKKGQVIHTWDTGSGGWLGVATAEHRTGGLLVEQVAEASPAAAIGLADGDVILRAEGQLLRATDDLARIIACHAAGDSLALEVCPAQQASPRTLSVTLTSRPTSKP
jgi:serine protease Do